MKNKPNPICTVHCYICETPLPKGSRRHNGRDYCDDDFLKIEHKAIENVRKR